MGDLPLPRFEEGGVLVGGQDERGGEADVEGELGTERGVKESGGCGCSPVYELREGLRLSV